MPRLSLSCLARPCLSRLASSAIACLARLSLLHLVLSQIATNIQDTTGHRRKTVAIKKVTSAEAPSMNSNKDLTVNEVKTKKRPLVPEASESSGEDDESGKR